jgi:FtsP/CotA-like multicopper oxidase with cupredoxin domain
MSSRGAARSLVLLLLSLLTPIAASAAAPKCAAPPPAGQPWGRALEDPPSISPVQTPQGPAIDSDLVMRERDGWVPVWTPQLCQGTYNACTTNADCAAGVPCVNKQTCSDSGAACGGNNDPACKAPAKCAKTWGWQCQSLRSYGWPKDQGTRFDPARKNFDDMSWGFPGPIFRARATTLADPTKPPGGANPVKSPGTRIKIKLYNYLTPQSYTEAGECIPATYNACSGTSYCVPARPAGGQTPCTQQSDCASVPNSVCLPLACTPSTPDKPDTVCPPLGAKCETRPVPQEHPNCFHGTSVTNFHLHGTHVSPQPHNDFVLLNLFPYGSQGVPTGRPVPDACDATGGDPYYAVGCYQVDVNPLPWNQAPGTHWYHPHKHGGTTAQVQNGMAGALAIGGAFDDWLNAFYDNKLVDRIMAVQDVSGQTANIEVPIFFKPGVPFPAKVLLNGYATPKIIMRPGEIQRWRFVGGTTQGATKLEIGLDPRIKEVRQIAQDGIQFAWENYCRQPLATTTPYISFQLAPGNRADFLVKAPLQVGTYAVNARIVAETLGPDAEVFHNLDPDAPAEGFGDLMLFKQRMPQMSAAPADRAPVDAKGNPLLFTIEIKEGAPVQPPMSFPVVQKEPPGTAAGSCPVNADCGGPSKPPGCWPATPYFLRDLDDPGKVSHQLAFTIDGNNGAQPNSFHINNTQYDPDCAGVTMPLGATQDWSVSNERGKNNTVLLAHPFHIHINPFQIVRNSDNTFSPPFIWWDTVALPVTGPGTSNDALAGPIWDNEDAKKKCPAVCLKVSNASWNGQWTTIEQGVMSVCGCVNQKDEVVLRQRYDDYTGGYVFHCHFLGHEDRGMMWNVQTVCKPDGPAKWGQPQSAGGADNCAVTSNALPACGAGTAHGGH